MGVFISPPFGGFLNTGLRDRKEFLRSKNLQSKPKVCTESAVGVPNETHPERISPSVEQFLDMVRFDQRSKLGELPVDLKASVRDERF